MELRQLKYYVNVVELMSYSEASKKLYISQSTLSQQIKQLEEELQVLFFNRNGKHISLTEAGRVFYQYAKDCIQKSKDAVTALEDLSNGNTGEMRIGITYALRNVITDPLITFHQRYPNIKVIVDYGSSVEMIEKLEKHEVDFLITFDMKLDQRVFQKQKLFETTVCLIVPADAPIQEVNIYDIGQYDLIVKSKRFNTSAFIFSIFQKLGIQPNIVMEVNDNPTLIELVKNKVGYSLMTDVVIRHEPGLKAVPIACDERMQRNVWAYSLTGTYVSRSVKAFYELLDLIEI